jgi:photosystem II stability/assembly factor-like uncharacterized protein
MHRNPLTIRSVAIVIASLAAVLALSGCGRESLGASPWRQLAPCPPVGEGGFSLAFADARHGFTHGFLDRGLYATTNGGRSWARCRGRILGATGSEAWLPASVDGLRLVAYVATVGRDVYLAYNGSPHEPGSGPSQPGTGVLVSRDLGRTWRPVLTLPRRECVLEVTGLDRSHLWVLCGDEPYNAEERWLLRTGDGGRTWQRMWQEPGGQAGMLPLRLSSIQLLDEERGWALARGGAARTDDGGATWVIGTYSSSTDAHLSVVEASHIWTCYGYSSEQGSDGGLWSTSDGGRTWDEQFEGQPVWGVYFKDPERGWIVTRHSILGTRDGGRHWQFEAEGPDSVGDLRFVQGGQRLYLQAMEQVLVRRVN